MDLRVSKDLIAIFLGGLFCLLTGVLVGMLYGGILYCVLLLMLIVHNQAMIEKHNHKKLDYCIEMLERKSNNDFAIEKMVESIEEQHYEEPEEQKLIVPNKYKPINLSSTIQKPVVKETATKKCPTCNATYSIEEGIPIYKGKEICIQCKGVLE